MELDLPSSSIFLLNATVPLPPAVYPSPDGKLSFGVLDYDGTLVPAQVEIVSRYPAASDGADIVQVWARVRRDPQKGAEARERYSVVEILYEPGPPSYGDLEQLLSETLQLPEGALGLIQNPGSVELRSKDVFGNEYALDLLAGSGGSSVLQQGPMTVQWMHHGNLLPVPPVSGSSGTLPYLMGVHSYPRVSLLDSILLLDLRVHNGSFGSNLQNPDPLSKMYFESLVLRVPNGWSVLADAEDPFFGDPYPFDATTTAYPIVAPNSDGTMHMMPAQAQFQRRLALAPTGSESLARAKLDAEGLAFCVAGTSAEIGEEYWSWFNGQTSRYFPQKHPLPNYDHIGASAIRANDAGSYNYLSNLLVAGAASPNGNPIPYAVQGWFHAMWGSYGGFTGGQDIHTSHGAKYAYAGSRFGVLYETLKQRMLMCRMPMTLYRTNGVPPAPEDFLKLVSGVQVVPFEYFEVPNGSSGPAFWKTNAPANFQVAAVATQSKKPFYEGTVQSYAPVDFQHYIRATRGAKALAFLANDALAKDDLRMMVESFRLSYHQYNNTTATGAQVSGLKAAMNFVAANPAKGFAFGRGEGWGLDAANVVYAMSDDAWKARTLPWLDIVVDTVAQGQGCNGVIRSQISGYFNNAWYGRQAFEEAIVQNALRGALHSVYLGGPDAGRIAQLKTSLVESVRSLISPVAWSATENAPWYHLAVGPLNLSLPLYCTSLPAGGWSAGWGETFQNWSSYAYAYEETLDPEFLNKVIAQGGGSVQALKSVLWAGGTQENSGNQTAILQLGQKLGYF